MKPVIIAEAEIITKSTTYGHEATGLLVWEFILYSEVKGESLQTTFINVNVIFSNKSDPSES